MAEKKEPRKDVFIKYVKKADCWCKTYWDKEGNQKQEWSETPDRWTNGNRETKNGRQ